MGNRLKITLTKSPIGYKHDQRETVHGLGLRKMWSTVVKDDTPSIRGMVNKVRHLVTVETVADDDTGVKTDIKAEPEGPASKTSTASTASTEGGDEA